MDDRETDLLRLTTAGSVDDGKSTLIGRLLYDTRSVPDDQLAAVERATRRRGGTGIDLSLLTDGLRAEREQGITIDVAYRYFSTPRRKFIIADTPGHVQYTRNMVTGASTADLAVVLVDAGRGVLTQSKRHGFIASLLRIPHLVVAVNKMDAVGWSAAVFEAIVAEYREFAEKLGIGSLDFIPVSALHGDNVATRSDRLPWYDGPTLLHYLENVHLGAGRNLVDFRFPVQYVIRSSRGYRGLAGRVASGTLTPGEEVAVLPAGTATRVRSIATMDGPVAEAAMGDSVVVTLEDEIDVGRGDMLVRRMNLPAVARRCDAVLCWLGDAPLDSGIPYILRHTTRTVRARVTRLLHRIDVDTLHRERVSTLGTNDIGRVELTTAQPICSDPYRANRETGSFVLVDPFTHATVAAGMIRGEVRPSTPPPGAERGGAEASPNVAWEGWNIPRAEREARAGHRAAVIWLTGLPGAGKTTLARALERELFARGCQTMLLDGDQLRHGLTGDLGFSEEDRRENVRRVGEVARLFFEQGSIVLCSLVSPFRRDRDRVRELLPEGTFFEVYVECDVEECRRRDPKGLYARADRGEVLELTGVSSPYEPPEHPELVARTDRESVAAVVARLLEHLGERGILGSAHAG
ncbi:MAG TPA: adenylyl-sulfate kinase [Longimicrobiaceae bacterium]|nr:adenylyl-sulfate kinase [Longimicrobiaceae bacterium]